MFSFLYFLGVQWMTQSLQKGCFSATVRFILGGSCSTCSQHWGRSSASTRVGPTCRANATHPVRIICLWRGGDARQKHAQHQHQRSPCCVCHGRQNCIRNEVCSLSNVDAMVREKGYSNGSQKGNVGSINAEYENSY